MQSDAYTRAALTAIAVLLLILVVRSFASGMSGASADEEGIAGDTGRYQLQNVRMGRATTVLRVDSETGDTWQLRGRNDDLAWHLMSEGDEAEEGEASAASEAPETAEDPAAAPQQQLTREQLNQALDRLRGGPAPAGRPAQGQLPPGHPAPAGEAAPGEAADPPGGGEAP